MVRLTLNSKCRHPNITTVETITDTQGTTWVHIKSNNYYTSYVPEEVLFNLKSNSKGNYLKKATDGVYLATALWGQHFHTSYKFHTIWVLSIFRKTRTAKNGIALWFRGVSKNCSLYESTTSLVHILVTLKSYWVRGLRLVYTFN